MLVTKSLFGKFHTSSSIISRKYCNRHDASREYLFSFLTRYLQRQDELSKNRYSYSKIATNMISDVKSSNPNVKISEKYDPRLMEIQEIFGKIVAENMLLVMNRTSGSQKGVMYYRDYYEEVYKKDKGYVDSLFERAHHIHDYEHPHFTFGNDFHHYIKKEDSLASHALHSFLEGPTSADCGSCVEAVYLKSVLQFIGEEKFNALFGNEQNGMRIRKWVTPDMESSLFPFLEFVDPQVAKETDENSLKVGDHVAIPGVPWYTLKHPEGSMQNMHGVVVGYNEAKKPLIGGLELKTPLTLEEIKSQLVDSYNNDQTKEDIELAKKFLGEFYLSPDHIASFLYEIPHIQSLDQSDIFKKYTVNEIKKWGGCTLQNEHSCRISPFVLAVLKTTENPFFLKKNLTVAKTMILVKQYLSLSKHSPGL